MKKVLFSLALATSAIFAVETSAQSVQIPAQNEPQVVPLSAENINTALAQIAMQANSALPKRLDYITVFDRVVAKDKALKYYYILNDDENYMLTKFKKAEKDKFMNEVKTNLKNNICKSVEIINLMSFGATFSYHFEVKNTGAKYFDIMLTSKDCK